MLWGAEVEETRGNRLLDLASAVAHQEHDPDSRDAVERLVAKHAAAAEADCPSIKAKNVTLHTLRHTADMSLLRSGVDTSVIALWLGHELAAEHCGFGLHRIDLLIEAARLALAECRFKAAANAALSALNGIGRDQMPRSEPGGDPQDLALLGTLHPLCGYVWD